MEIRAVPGLSRPCLSVRHTRALGLVYGLTPAVFCLLLSASPLGISGLCLHDIYLPVALAQQSSSTNTNPESLAGLGGMFLLL